MDFSINTNLCGFELKLKTTYGLFSYKEIDEGTKLLIERLSINESETCFDLGCGYGVVGIVMAKLAPKGKTYLVDRDFVAVDYSNMNIKENKITNAEALLSDGFSHLKQIKFDVIASNLPSHVSNDMLREMIKEAKTHLNENGRFYVVTVSALRHLIKREFSSVFGNYEKLKQGRAHTVSLAIKKSSLLGIDHGRGPKQGF